MDTLEALWADVARDEARQTFALGGRGRQCGATQGGYRCSRAYGHEDPHVALEGGRRCLLVWEEPPEPIDPAHPHDRGWGELARQEYPQTGPGGGARPYCPATASTPLWHCSRPQGHSGPHVALERGSKVLEVWGLGREQAPPSFLATPADLQGLLAYLDLFGESP